MVITVDTEREFESRLDAFLRGAASLDALWVWLRLHVQALAESDRPEIRHAEAVLSLLMGELDLGYKTEEELRFALEAEVRRSRPGALRADAPDPAIERVFREIIAQVAEGPARTLEIAIDHGATPRVGKPPSTDVRAGAASTQPTHHARSVLLAL